MQKPALQDFARLGYAAHGVVYMILGGLAILAAVGTRGPEPDSKGALVALLSQPFGALLLALSLRDLRFSPPGGLRKRCSTPTASADR